MKKTAILLVLILLSAGLPAEASVMPLCPAVLQMPAQPMSCCPTGHCDCQVKPGSNEQLQVTPSVTEFRFELNATVLSQAAVGMPKDSFKFLTERQESPPQESPLYDLYSDYRI